MLATCVDVAAPSHAAPPELKSIVSERKWTEPSVNRKLAPPGCRLLAPRSQTKSLGSLIGADTTTHVGIVTLEGQMHLSGQLTDWSINDLLQIMQVTQKTGSLDIDGERRGRVHFRDGSVTGAELSGLADDLRRGDVAPAATRISSQKLVSPQPQSDAKLTHFHVGVFTGFIVLDHTVSTAEAGEYDIDIGITEDCITRRLCDLRF